MAERPDILQQQLSQLAAFVSSRIQSYFSPEARTGEVILPETLIRGTITSPLDRFCEQHRLSAQTRVIILLALAPHLQADFYDSIIKESIPHAGDFPQIGCARGRSFRGFLPTGETALFLLGGERLEARLEVHRLFSEDHQLIKKHVLWLEDVPEGEPRMSGRIIMAQEYVDLFVGGRAERPRFSINFPAQLVNTEMRWDDLVLHGDTLAQIRELETWIKHGSTLMDTWGMRRQLKPGYRVLFHGPPGTGKTLTASLLGRYAGKDVYRIDLSLLVSKFIGETEKNLANLFARAEDRDWILFFDEADALFGKRTSVRDAHDKYANQEVSYLLQRVEDYDGLVILATNFKSNIDDAFSRRFQAIINFPMPAMEERTRLWQKAFPAAARLAEDINLQTLSQKYELSGAEIMNIVQHACLRALDRQSEQLQHSDIYSGIKREFQKEGKILR